MRVQVSLHNTNVLGVWMVSGEIDSTTDFSPLYALHERSTLILMDGRTYNDLGQMEDSRETKKVQHGKALDSLMQIGSMQISERMRLEFLNDRARVSFRLRDLEQCCTYLESAVTGALLLGSEQRYSEAREIYEMMTIVWSDEPRVKALRDLFKRG
jgi:hypothetical protein